MIAVRSLRSGSHADPGQCQEQDESVDLLQHARWHLRAELTLADIRALHELEEFLDIPAHVVQLVELAQTELVLRERSEEVGERSIRSPDLDCTQIARTPMARTAFRWLQAKSPIFGATLLEFADDGEGVGARHTNQEVDSEQAEVLHDLMRGVASIQDQDVPGFEAWKHRQQMSTLVAGKRGDFDVHRELGTHVQEHADENLRTIGALRCSELRVQVVAALQVDLGAIDGEHALSMPATRSASATLEGVLANLMQHVPQKIRSDLRPRRAERSGGDRRLRRERQTVTSRFVPEAIEQVLIPTSIPVRDHVQHESRQKLRVERAVARKISLVAPKPTLVNSRENLGNKSEDFAKILGGGMKIGRLPCQWSPFFRFSCEGVEESRCARADNRILLNAKHRVTSFIPNPCCSKMHIAGPGWRFTKSNPTRSWRLMALVHSPASPGRSAERRRLAVAQKAGSPVREGCESATKLPKIPG